MAAEVQSTEGWGETIKTWGPVVAVGLAFSLGAIKDAAIYLRKYFRANQLVEEVEQGLKRMIIPIDSDKETPYLTFKSRELDARATSGLAEQNESFVHQHASMKNVLRFEKVRRLIYHLRDLLIHINVNHNMSMEEEIASASSLNTLIRIVKERYNSSNL